MGKFERNLFKNAKFRGAGMVFVGLQLVWVMAMLKPEKVFPKGNKDEVLQDYLGKQKIELVGKSDISWEVRYENTEDSCNLRTYYFDCNKDGESDVWVKVDVNNAKSLVRDSSRKIGMIKSEQEWNKSIYDDIIDMGWVNKRQKNKLYREIKREQKQR